MRTAVKKKGIVVLSMILVAVFSFINTATVYAYDDGAYVVTRTASYVNPDTGLTYYGDTGNATGENMVSKIMASDVMVEISNGHIYVTIGLGMYSAISNVRIQVQDVSGGAFRQVSYTTTGSSTMNGDTCMHYRFEVSNPNLIISPKFTVDGMGKELEFYVLLNMSSMKEGTSIYTSGIINNEDTSTSVPSSSTSSWNTVESSDDTQTQTTEEQSSETSLEEDTIDFSEKEAEIDELLAEDSDLLLKAKGLSTHYIMKKSTSTTTIKNTSSYIYWGVLGTVVILLAGGYLYRKKKII